MLQPVTNPLLSLADPAAAPPSQGAARGTPSVRAALRDALLAPVTASDRPAGGARASAAAKSPKRKAASSSTSAGYAKSAATAKPSSSSAKAPATSKSSGPLAFLDDPKLSLEDKLVRLLSYLNAKWDKELEAKLKELKGGAEAAKKPASTAAKSSSKGLLGSVVGVAKQFFPQVGVALDVLQDPIARGILSKVGGPVLAAAATAVGFPQLAPLALSYGPALVDAAAGLATSVGDGPPEVAAPAAAASPSPKTSTASAGAKPGDAALSSDRDAQLKLMEIQRVMDQQKEMFSLVSNLLRTGHDTRMAVIQNVR